MGDNWKWRCGARSYICRNRKTGTRGLWHCGVPSDNWKLSTNYPCSFVSPPFPQNAICLAHFAFYQINKNTIVFVWVRWLVVLISCLVILSTYGLPPPPPILPLSLVFVCVICDEYLLSFNRHRLLILGGGDGRGRGLSTLFPLCMQGPFIRFCVYFGIEHSLWERKSSCFVLNNVLFLCVAGKANGFGVSFECPL